MRVLCLILLALLIFSFQASSQSCLPNGIEFNTQSAIDSFPINYPGCTEIEGNLKIKGFGITNVDSLNSIERIGGELRIEINPDLLLLTGLSSLKSIAGNLILAGNYMLSDLKGLDSLQSIGKSFMLFSNGLKNFQGISSIKKINQDFIITDHDSIKDLNGLESIDSIIGGFILQGNDNLINLEGLNSLKYLYGISLDQNSSLLSLKGLDSLRKMGTLGISVCHKLKNVTNLNALKYLGGLSLIYNNGLVGLNGLIGIDTLPSGIRITNCDSIKDLSGLDSVSSIGGIVFINRNDALTSLKGLENLKSIGGYLRIDENASLKTLSSLQKIESIGGYLFIEDNDSLRDLEGLENIKANSITDLYLQGNDNLSFCSVKSVCDFLSYNVRGHEEIENNDCGCNSVAEVEAACASYEVELNIKCFLQGAFQGNNLMNTNLTNLLPNDQPYNCSPWLYPGNEHIDSVPSNMVDWILVELRDSSDYNVLYETKAGVLFSDGSIKAPDLQDGIRFYVDSGYYYVAIRHRNHISVMTEQAVFLASQTFLDFTDTISLKPYSGASQAQIELEPGVWGLICGDVNRDGRLQYSGPDNDRQEIIQTILNTTASTNITSVINGYYVEDLNLNGEVKYSGPNNDGSVIIQNITILTGSYNITTIYSCPVMFLYP